MNEQITSCWDTFILINSLSIVKYPICPVLERLYDLSGEMELARDEKNYDLANKCIRKFRRIVRKLAERN